MGLTVSFLIFVNTQTGFLTDRCSCKIGLRNRGIKRFERLYWKHRATGFSHCSIGAAQFDTASSHGSALLKQNFQQRTFATGSDYVRYAVQTRHPDGYARCPFLDTTSDLYYLLK
jgi:hypothetical protein